MLDRRVKRILLGLMRQNRWKKVEDLLAAENYQLIIDAISKKPKADLILEEFKKQL